MNPRIFVGCPAGGEDAEAMMVLENSLRRHASTTLDITWMMLSKDKKSFWYSHKSEGWQTTGWATPFSGLRWAIPEFCEFEGRAIYMDSDIIARADIVELWDMPMGDRAMLMKGKLTAVLLMDCSRMKALVPPVSHQRTDFEYQRRARNELMPHAGNFVGDGDWNCRDGESFESAYDQRIKLLHYTKIPTQPTHVYARKRLKAEKRKHWFSGPDEKHRLPDMQKLFDEEYVLAQIAGYTIKEYVRPAFGSYGRGKADDHHRR